MVKTHLGIVLHTFIIKNISCFSYDAYMNHWSLYSLFIYRLGVGVGVWGVGWCGGGVWWQDKQYIYNDE